MKKSAIVTLCVGNEYLQMGIALMQSCRSLLRDQSEYVIFYTRSSPRLFHRPHWIKFEKIDDVYPIKNHRSGRRYKAMVLCHEKYVDRDILYLDADTIAYANCFDKLFGIIKNRSILIYGTKHEDDAAWFTDKNGKRYNFRQTALTAGFDVRNLHLNGGIIGRAGDHYGIDFSKRLLALLDKMPLAPFWDITQVDEPYISLAFQLTTKGTDKGHYSLDYKTYVTTAGGHLSKTHEGWPTVHKPHLNIVADRAAIIHYVGHSQFPFYLKTVRQKAPCVAYYSAFLSVKALFSIIRFQITKQRS